MWPQPIITPELLRRLLDRGLVPLESSTYVDDETKELGLKVIRIYAELSQIDNQLRELENLAK